MLTPYGTVISTRILRDGNHQPRGVGFARMDAKDKCDMIIQAFNGKVIPGSKEPLLVKFADGGNKKKSQYKTDIRDNGAGLTALHYEQSGLGQNRVAPQHHLNLMPSMAAGYQRSPYANQLQTAAYASALQASNPWIHPAAAQYHFAAVPSPASHMPGAQMIPSHTMGPNAAALQFSALMPQLSAQMSQLQLSGASVSFAVFWSRLMFSLRSPTKISCFSNL